MRGLVISALFVGALLGRTEGVRADDSPEPGGTGQDLTDSLEASTVSVARNGASWKATPQGAFTYSVPIVVPQGTGNLQPELSLVYSSLAGNGIAGYGWSLQGIPSVHRVRGPSGINYDGNDTYALNLGSWGTAPEPRDTLVPVAAGVYHTRDERFADVRPSARQCGAGPCYWTMRDGHGRTYTFGDVSATAPPKPGSGTNDGDLWETNNVIRANRGISVWSLTQVSDLHGNLLTVEYLDPSGNGDEMVPSRIAYSFSAVQPTPMREVLFWYETRPDQTTPPYWFDRRLTRLDIKANGQVDHSYVLSYVPGPVSGRSLLFSIQELGNDGVTAAAPVSFRYQPGRPLTSAATIQHAIGPRSASPGTDDTGAILADQLLAGDFDGDGRKDLVSIRRGAVGREIHYALGTNSGLSPVIDYFNDVASNTKYYDWTGVTGDVNGDGKDDLVLVHFGPDAVATQVALGTPTGLAPLQDSGNAAPWGPIGTTPTVCDAAHDSEPMAWWCGVRVFGTDLNGDHFMDILWTHPQGHSIAYALGSPTGIGAVVATPPPAQDINHTVGIGATVGDFTGNRQFGTFMMNAADSYASFALGGAGPYSAQELTINPAYYLASDVVAVDMNGDKRTDVAYATNGPSLSVFFSQSGPGTQGPPGPTFGPAAFLFGTNSADLNGYRGTFAGDFDGDGVGDVDLSLLFNEHNDPSNIWNSQYVYMGSGQTGSYGAIAANVPPSYRYYDPGSIVADTNGDGRSEILWIDAPNETTDPLSAVLTIGVAWVSRDRSGFEGTANLTPDADGQADSFNIALHPDINGDGIDDLVLQPGPLSQDTDFRLVLSSGEKPDLLQSVTTTSGAHIDVSYTPAAWINGAIRPTASGCYSNPLFVQPPPTGNCGIPNAHPRHLVTHVIEDNGRGTTHGTTYYYFDGRYDPTDPWADYDRGFLTTSSYDDLSGNAAGVALRQDPPYAGRIFFTASQSNNLVIRQRTLGFAPATTDAPRTILVTPDESQEIDIAQGSLVGVHDVKTTTAYGPYGAPVAETTCDGSVCTTRTSSYTHDTSRWLLNRLDSWDLAVGDGTADPEQRLGAERRVYANNGFDLSSRDSLLCADAAACSCPKGGDCASGVARWVTVESGRSYDPVGNLTHVVDALGHPTDYTYDPVSNGRATETRYLASGSSNVPFVKSWRYDAAGRTTQAVDVANHQTSTAYDPLGRPHVVSFPSGEIDTLKYVAFGDATQQYVRTIRAGDGNSLVTDRYFDGNGAVYLDQKNGDAGEIVEVSREEAWTASGHTVTRTAPHFIGVTPGLTDVQMFDVDNRLVADDQITSAGTVRRRSIAYSPRTVATTNSLGQTTTDTLDDRGLLSQRQDALGTTTHVHDAVRRETQVSLPPSAPFPQGSAVVTRYDGWGRVVSTTDPARGTDTVVFDDVGNVLQTTDGVGTAIAFTYDSLGRKATRVGPTGKWTFRYDNPANPDGRGQLWRVTDMTGSTELGYDAAARLTSRKRTVVAPTGGTEVLSSGFGFDALGRAVSHTFPDGYALTYTWTDGGNLSTVTGSDGVVYATATSPYDAAGNALGVTTPVGTTTRTFTGTNRLATSVVTTINREIVQNLTYGYDKEDNPQSVTDGRADKLVGGIDTDESQTFTYDAGERLWTATGTYGTKTYAYDALGNILDDGSGAITYQPRSFTGPNASGTYDDAGKLLRRSVGQDEYEFAYDDRQRMIDAQKVAGPRGSVSVGQYAYDWSGVRVRAIRGAVPDRVVTYTSDDYEERRLTLPHSPVSTTKWIDAPGLGVVAVVTTGSIRDQPTAAEAEAAASGPWSGSTEVGMPPGVWYVLETNVGSTSTLLDSQGHVVSRLRYEPYGRLDTAHSAGFDAVTKKFTRQDQDEETGLAYFGARYYDPVVARFTTTDPVLNERSLVSFNRYAYGLDSPQRYVDPTGRDPAPPDPSGDDPSGNPDPMLPDIPELDENDNSDPTQSDDGDGTQRGLSLANYSSRLTLDPQYSLALPSLYIYRPDSFAARLDPLAYITGPNPSLNAYNLEAQITLQALSIGQGQPTPQSIAFITELIWDNKDLGTCAYAARMNAFLGEMNGYYTKAYETWRIYPGDEHAAGHAFVSLSSRYAGATAPAPVYLSWGDVYPSQASVNANAAWPAGSLMQFTTDVTGLYDTWLNWHNSHPPVFGDDIIDPFGGP